MPGWLSSLRDLIVEASPWRRFMLALLVLLPLAALAAAYLWFNPPAYRVLYTQLSDRAGGEVIAALEQLDIPYRLSAADGTIEVPADQLHAARYRLAARGLPKSDADAQDEVDRAPSFGASSLQEQQRYQRALEIDLARSIQKHWKRSSSRASISPCPRSRRSCAMRRPPPLPCWCDCARARSCRRSR